MADLFARDAATPTAYSRAMAAIRKHLFVHGRVQGVGYRWSMLQEAVRLGVHGWVRNRRDGTVEAVIAGDVAAVDALLAWARGGPAGAVVARVDDLEVASPDALPSPFEQRPSA